jgi:uncharacterized protein (TIGR02679 family)
MTANNATALDKYREPSYERLMAAARRSLERTGGQLTGRISVQDPSDAERRAIFGITGIHQPRGTKRLTVQLEVLDGYFRRATGFALPEVLASLGGPLRDRPAAVASLAAARTALRGIAEASPLYDSDAWYRAWLSDLTADGTLTRLANTIPTPHSTLPLPPTPDSMIMGRSAQYLGETTHDHGEGRGEVRAAVHVLEYLAGRPAGFPIALPALAAQITGDTKALNPGTTLTTLVLRALALREGVPRPGSAAERRDLWDSAGVVVDDLASRVLVLNLPASGEGLGEWLAGAARYGTPFQVTLHQLDTHPIRLAAARLFACENPAVLRRACAELGSACPPLICAEGQPSTAFHRLAQIAISAGCELVYHGDFDWPGVAITAAIITRHSACPWRMTAADYLAGVAAGTSATAGPIPLAGTPVATPWDPGLAQTMLAAGRAVYEELVADQLLTDLRAAVSENGPADGSQPPKTGSSG